MPAHRTGQMVQCAICKTEVYRKAHAVKAATDRGFYCSITCRNARGPVTNLSTRFWAGVDRSNPDGCWPWKRARRNEQGHGGVWDGKRWTHAHRVAYRLAHGPIPTSMDVCHRCDNPPCCRPDHLFLGSHAENMADMAAKRRTRRVSPEVEAQALTLLRAGLTQRDAGAALGLGKTTIARIARRA